MHELRRSQGQTLHFPSMLAAEFLITFKLTRRVSRMSVLVREFTDFLLFDVNMMQIYCMDAKIGACVCIHRSGLIHCNTEMFAEEKKSSIASFQNHRFLSVLCYIADRDSSVGIATCYLPDCPGVESWWRRDFPHPLRPALDPT